MRRLLLWMRSTWSDLCSGTVMNELQHLHFCKQKDSLCFDRRRCDMSLPGESGFAQDIISISHALFLCGAGSQQLSCLASRMIDRKRRRLLLWKNGLELSNFICNWFGCKTWNRAHDWNRQVNRSFISWWRTGLTVMPDLDRTNLVRQGFAFFFVAILLDYAIHRHHSTRESVDCHVHVILGAPNPRKHAKSSKPKTHNSEVKRFVFSMGVGWVEVFALFLIFDISSWIKFALISPSLTV